MQIQSSRSAAIPSGLIRHLQCVLTARVRSLEVFRFLRIDTDWQMSLPQELRNLLRLIFTKDITRKSARTAKIAYWLYIITHTLSIWTTILASQATASVWKPTMQ